MLIANIWIGIPFNLVIMYSGLQSIPADVFEAAAIDGASGWQRFWRITFPLLRPVSAITLLLGFIYTLKVFDIIWIMTSGGPATASTTLAIWSYQLGFGSLLPDFSSAAAVGNVLIVIAVIFALVYIRVRRRLEAIMNRAAPGGCTAIGVLLTAVMLFPVYWMINVSLTQTSNMRKSPPNLIPVDGTLDGYSAVLHQQLPYLGTSLLIGLGTVALTLVARRARLATRWPSCARAAAALLSFAAADRPDDPGDRHGDGLLHHLHQARPPQHRAGAHPRRLHHRRAVRRADLHRVHVADPR